jgi:hypothetical protein
MGRWLSVTSHVRTVCTESNYSTIQELEDNDYNNERSSVIQLTVSFIHQRFDTAHTNASLLKPATYFNGKGVLVLN